jgi:hypothetical protein
MYNPKTQTLNLSRVVILRVLAADRLLNLGNAGVEAKALLVGVTRVLNTGSNPDAPGSVHTVIAGDERSVVLAEDEVAGVVNLPALCLGVARVGLSLGILKNTLAWNLLVNCQNIVVR